MAAETPDINDLATRLQRLEQFQHSTAYAQMIRIEQVQAQVAAPAAALGVLDFRIQQVQTELVGFRAEVHTELETIKSDISGLKSDVSELRSGVFELKSGVSELRSDVSGLKSDVSELKSDSVTVKTSLVSHGELLQKILDRLPAN